MNEDLRQAILNGDMVSIEAIRETVPVDALEALELACTRDNFAPVSLFYSLLTSDDDISVAVSNACKVGSFDIVSLLASEEARNDALSGPQHPVQPSSLLAAGGFLEAFKLIPVSSNAMMFAAAAGQANIIDYLISQGVVADLEVALEVATLNGHLHVISLIDSYLNPLDPE